MLASALAFAVGPADAQAGTYDVLSCDAAALDGWSTDGWAPAYSVAGAGYAACPTGGDDVKGISSRLVHQSVPRNGFSLEFFKAPPGTTITKWYWKGRAARGDCNWDTVLTADPGNVLMAGYYAHDYCGTNSFDFRGPGYTFVPPAGTNQVAQIIKCRASTCESGATIHTTYSIITINDPLPPSIDGLGGDLTNGYWVSGHQPIYFKVSDNAGIHQVRADIPGVHPAVLTYPCSAANSRRCPTTLAQSDMTLLTHEAPDGLYSVHIEASDGAGNVIGADRTVRIDNTPPDAIRPEVVGGDAWRRGDQFDIKWPEAPQDFAPIARLQWELCAPDETCKTGAREGSDNHLNGVSLSQSGDHDLRVWLEDEAGNQRQPPAYDVVHLRRDAAAPALGFEKPDPLDPLRLSVAVSDKHSGLGGGDIELRRRGGDTWHELPTTATPDHLVAYVDDERFRNGSYEFRARAVDRAGNEATTYKRLDGTAASLRLPVRIGTRLRVGFAKFARSRKVVGRGRHRHVVRRRRLVLHSSGRATYGSRVRLRGVITNPDGQPLDGASINVFDLRKGDRLTPVGIAHADNDGRFSYTARASRSRVLRFAYSGSHRIRSASRDVLIGVPATSTIKANRYTLLNGEQVTFRGRLKTRPIPATGKLVEVQAFFRGEWRTISTVRADRRGRWTFPYRFGGTAGTVKYRFRVQLPSEGGYPFATGHSPAVQVTVRGL